VRAIDRYTDAAEIEVDILDALKKNDPEGKVPCIQLLSWFTYKKHVCMVFERYGLSLYDFMKKNKYRGFDIKIVKDFTRQLLESIACIQSFIINDLSFTS
jgi:dual-specificity kinase